MVIGHLRRVEHALRLLQRLAANGLNELCIRCHALKLRLIQAVHRLRAFRIDVVRQVLRIHTRIGRIFLLVECLDEVQRHLCRIAELPVAIHLQRRQVIQLWRLFFALFLLHLRHRKRLALDGGKGLFAFLLRRKLT